MKKMKISSILILPLLMTGCFKSSQNTYYGITLGDKVGTDFKQSKESNIYCKKDTKNQFDSVCVDINDEQKIKKILLYKDGESLDLANDIHKQMSIKYTMNCQTLYHSHWRKQMGFECSTTDNNNYIFLKVLSNRTAGGSFSDVDAYTLVTYEHIGTNSF